MSHFKHAEQIDWYYSKGNVITRKSCRVNKIVLCLVFFFFFFCSFRGKGAKFKTERVCVCVCVPVFISGLSDQVLLYSPAECVFRGLIRKLRVSTRPLNIVCVCVYIYIQAHLFSLIFHGKVLIVRTFINRVYSEACPHRASYRCAV